MIAADRLAVFLVTAFVLVAVPGPSVLFVVSRSLAQGRTAGLATVAGNAIGVYVQVIAVALGVGAVVERSIAVFTVIKLAGACYLGYLGVQAIRHRRGLGEVLQATTEARSVRRLVRDAFVVGVSNPKAVVIFVAVLPQFVDRSAGNVPGQLLLLGAIFFAIALVSDGAWALAAGTARGWLTSSPRRLEFIGGASGVAMIGIGIRLALTGRKD